MAHVASAQDMMEESNEEDDEDWEMVEPFILHMLNNSGELTVAQIRDQLKNFADVDKPDSELRKFLDEMVKDDKCGKKGDKYVSV
jgi:hypothetical protein